jgi:energy-coupling factor transporter ATP-binding protein EcfA2
MIYKAIRRNQRIENKRMAMVSTLSICSWILSLSVRFEDVCPNLMILLIAPSGSGKSTSTKAIKELIKLNKKLQLSYFGQDIRSDSSIFTSIQESPIGFYNIDEASKLFKTMGNGGANQNLPEILSQLYSDYKDTDPPNALAKLKNEAYGVSIGAKINMLAYSTPAFWETFDEGNYTQGLGRRLFIVTSSTLPVEKTNYVYSPDFFTKDESALISMFMNTYIGTSDLFKTVDIKGFDIIENVTVKDGVKTTKHFQTCKRPNIRFRLEATKETDTYLKDQFVKESNEFRVKAASSGSPIQEYVANSRAEFIKKFAIIHAVCGKKMTVKKVLKEDPIAMNINTQLGMESIEWGKQMFDYYMIGSTLENIDSIFGKDKVTDRNNHVIEELLERLNEKEIKDFKKSDQIIRNFFKMIGGAEYRNTILKEMSAKNIIKIIGDLDHRGCRIKLL